MKKLILPLALLLVLALAAPVDAATLTLKFTRFTSPVARSATATVAVLTTAKARCTIGVYYSTTASRAAGLGAKTAPATGRISWSWKIGSNTKKGSWPVKVTCKLGSQTKTISRKIVVK
jgi:micrococcal nuclease